MKHWIRTCQECGLKQVTKPPMEYAGRGEVWRDKLCKECKSPALNYGTWEDDGKENETELDQ